MTLYDGLMTLECTGGREHGVQGAGSDLHQVRGAESKDLRLPSAWWVTRTCTSTSYDKVRETTYTLSNK